MARQKNALTEYYVGAIPQDGMTEPEYFRLAKWISTVTDDSEEETESIGYYDGDGTPETDVISVAKTYTFEGFYDDEDRSEEHTSELQSRPHLVCRLLLEKKKKKK